MLRRIHVLSAGLESANTTRECHSYTSDSHVQRWTAPKVRCISLRFQLVDTSEAPEPTQASQLSQTILNKTTQARRNSSEKLTSSHCHALDNTFCMVRLCWLACICSGNSGVLTSWNRSDMHLTSGAVQYRTFESLIYEWRSRAAWPTEAHADET